MSTPDRLTRLLQAARRAPAQDASVPQDAPPGLATRLAALAWKNASSTPPVPWLRGLTWGMAASVCALVTAHLALPPPGPPVPDLFSPMLSAVGTITGKTATNSSHPLLAQR